MNSSMEIVPFTADAAARPGTQAGWFSRDGHFFWGDGAEQRARWAGCTHRKCEACDAIVPRDETRCASCRLEKSKAMHGQLPLQSWDGETPLYSTAFSRFIFDQAALLQLLHDTRASIPDLLLVWCEPILPACVDADVLFEDELPDGGSAPKVLQDLVDEFNGKVAALNLVLSWSPTNVRVAVPLELIPSAG